MRKSAVTDAQRFQIPGFALLRFAMPDLVIGGRRAGAPRPWRSGVIALAMLAVTVVVTWFIYRRSVSYEVPPGSVEGELSSIQGTGSMQGGLAFGNASLRWLGGIAVLRVAGDGHAIGAAHGRLLAPWLAPAIAALAPTIAETVAADGMLGGVSHGIRLAWQWRFIDDGLDDPDRRMVAGAVRGMAASGVAVEFDELLRGQAVLDVGEPSPRSDAAGRRVVARSLTVIGSQALVPARLWIGRTLALPGLDDGGASAQAVVTIARPDGRIAWAGVGWPGQLGVVTGINAEAIAVMVNPVRTSDVRVARAARPVAQLARSVLEQARTLDEAIRLIEGSPTLGSAVIAVVDGKIGKWAHIERTPSKSIVERNPKSPALGDVLTSHALAGDPENDRARRALPTPARVERAAKLIRIPLTDVSALAQILRDRRGPDDAPRPPGHRGAIDDARAVHSVIIDPAGLALWIADPSAGGRMRGLDLRHELRTEPPPDLAREIARAQPPADIPADTGAEIDRAGLAAARADLRLARAALAAGELVRAGEATARARARAPSLPEALELEAIVAHARGDLARARTAFQVWLDGGPDDPLGEQRARAALAR